MFYCKHKNLAGTTLPVDDQDDHNQVNDDSHADLADVETHFHTHAVPFMVLGSTHHNGMQAALRAKKKELERPSLVRKDIVARIRPEPDNEKDAKAIVIEINCSEGYKSIGYIPRELTKFLHPLNFLYIKK